MQLSDEYLAGLFDGEGWLKITRYNHPKYDYSRYQLVLGVGNTYYPVVKTLHDQFGGILSRTDSAKKRNPNNRTSYNWVIASGVAKDFLLRVRPFVLVKHDQVELAIRFQNHMDRYRLRMKGYRLHAPERHNRLRRRAFAYRQLLADRILTLKKVEFDVPFPKRDPEIDRDPLSLLD